MAVVPFCHLCGSEKCTWEKKVGVTGLNRPCTNSTHVQSSLAQSPVKTVLSTPLLCKCASRISSGAYKWDGKPTTGCNAAPGATVSPPRRDTDGTEAGSPLWDHRAGRAAHTGRQIHIQVSSSVKFQHQACFSSHVTLSGLHGLGETMFYDSFTISNTH